MDMVVDCRGDGYYELCGGCVWQEYLNVTQVMKTGAATVGCMDSIRFLRAVHQPVLVCSGGGGAERET
jgi:hypothetical protein